MQSLTRRVTLIVAVANAGQFRRASTGAVDSSMNQKSTADEVGNPPKETASQTGESTQAASWTTSTTTTTTTESVNNSTDTTAKATTSPASSSSPSEQAQSQQLKVNDDGEFEPMRWIQRAYEDPDLVPKTDDKGEYIVSKVQWPTGEMAYRPLPRTEVTPRFGYNIISVKKPQTYWQYWRKNPHFNFTYVGIQGVFILGMAWLMGFLFEEIRRYEQEGRASGNHAGEVRGKGRTDRKKEKIVFTPEEQETMLLNAQESYLEGSETKYLGNANYKMKKIARPSEYNYDDFRKR